MIIARRTFLAAGAALSVGGARADTAPLRLVFPFPAGGGADSLLRLLAERLRERLGRPVVVENVTGAGGRIGVRTVRDAPPDGRTLLFTSGAQMFLQPHLFRNVGYDPFADFVPLLAAVTFDQALAVATDSPARAPADLADAMRAQPANASYGSPGAGTLGHFAGAEFGRLAKLDLRHVPYRGTPSALPDLMAGRLGMLVASAGELIEHHRAGKLRIVAIARADRSRLLPDIPTLRESGFDVVAPGYFAFYAPAGTSPAQVTTIATAIASSLESSELEARMGVLGFERAPAGDLVSRERAEHGRWAEIVRASGFRPEE